MTQQEALVQRYGGRSAGRRRAVYAGSALVAVVFLGWLGWAIWLNSDPAVTSQLQSFTVRDDHTVDATVQVHVQSGARDVVCTVTALAADHTTVGERTFEPDPSRTTQPVEIRTDRRATAIESKGCTASGQDRPR